jgi:hypothetical protein
MILALTTLALTIFGAHGVGAYGVGAHSHKSRAQVEPLYEHGLALEQAVTGNSNIAISFANTIHPAKHATHMTSTTTLPSNIRNNSSIYIK